MSEIINTAAQCLKDEAEAILNMLPRLNDEFEKAVNIILDCKGKCIVTGVGKSGHIGRKIAATLASTGTPAFFLNPLDAYHGDLGMVTREDVVIAISYSGNTDELLRIIPSLLNRHIPIIALTGNDKSLLAQHSTCRLDVSVSHEADPLDLAPTSSTTTTLAMGDAIACALIRARGFQATDFAQFHPGGTLGKRLLAQVGDYMVSSNLPIAHRRDPLSDTIFQISKTKQGITVVLDDDKIVGVVTDGDIRRALQSDKDNFFNLCVEDVMSTNPKKVLITDKLETAAMLMKKHDIHSLIVVDDNDKYVGLIDYFSCRA